MKIQMRLSEAIDTYLGHRAASGARPNTVKNDESCLLRFLSQAGNIYVRSVEQRHVDTFFAAPTPPWSAGYRNVQVSILKGFFGFCRRNRWIDRDADPLAGYRKLRLEEKERTRIPVTEFSKLLDTATHPRDRMVIALGLFLFLRVNEMAALLIQDVNLESGEIAVQISKSRKHDVMQINPQLDRELRRYLTWYATHGPIQPDWFLVPACMPPLGERDPWTGKIISQRVDAPRPLKPRCKLQHGWLVVQRVLHQLGYATQQEGVHTLRRSGARAFYDELCRRQGLDPTQGFSDSALEIVSAMLHHSHMTTTQVYLGIKESKRKRDRAIQSGPMFPILEAQQELPRIGVGEGGTANDLPGAEMPA